MSTKKQSIFKTGPRIRVAEVVRRAIVEGVAQGHRRVAAHALADGFAPRRPAGLDSPIAIEMARETERRNHRIFADAVLDELREVLDLEGA